MSCVFLYLKNLLDVAEHEDHHQVLFVLLKKLVVKDCFGEILLYCQSILQLRVQQHIIDVKLKGRKQVMETDCVTVIDCCLGRLG